MNAGVPAGRVVAVRGRLSADELSVGSGTLIGSRLVLTSAHVVLEPDGRPVGPLSVRLAGSSRWWTATVVWSDIADAVDVALLDVTDTGWTMSALSPLRWGRLTGLAGGVPCEALGLPRSMRQNEERIREHVTGHVNPGMDETGRWYDLHVREFPQEPPPRAGEPSPWSGMSGAGLFANGLLIGVLTLRTGGFGERRLRATPTHILATDTDFRNVVTGGGRLPVASVELTGLFTDDIEDWAPSPALLLHPARKVVGFYGRVAEREDLSSWCGTGAGGEKLRILVGPGGQGKTRLAGQLCDDLIAAGWVAGFVAADAAPDQISRLVDTAAPVLVVVDYAETRHEQLRDLLRVLRGRTAGPVRLLLLARTAEPDRGWWSQLRAEHPDLCTTVTPRKLEPLQDSHNGSADQTKVYRQVTADLARVWAQIDKTADWPALAAALPIPPAMNTDRHRHALTLHTTALAALLQAGPSPVPPGTPGGDIADVLLAHEQRYWTITAVRHGLHPRHPDVLLRWAVTAAALCGATSSDEARDVLARLPELHGEPASTRLAFTEWLRQIYPASDNRYWGSLQPNRIAEHLIGQVLTAPSDPHPEMARALLETAAPGQLHHALIILARAAHHQRAVPALLADLLDHSPIQGAASQFSLDDLISILDALPERSVSLAHAALTLTSHVVTHLRRTPHADEMPPPNLAVALNNLAAYLCDLGQREDAFVAATEAADLYRQLAHNHPDTFNPDLANAMTNLSNRLASLGRREEALRAVLEAVSLSRRLAEDHTACNPNLANALNTLSNRLAGLGRREEALNAATEATDLYRQLAHNHPDTFNPDLASTLNNLSIRLSDLSRREEALNAATEATDLYRQLAHNHPDTFNPDLANAMNALSSALSSLGQREEALNAVTEAVDRFRQLAQIRPDAFNPDLALTLNNLAIHLSGVGRRNDALAAVFEAAGLYRKLTQTRPDAFNADLALTLNNLSNGLADLGRRDEALATALEATGLCRDLAHAHPDTFNSDLANALNNLSNRLSDLGRWEEALNAATEAAVLYRQLAHARPDTFGPNLATALHTLSNVMAAVDQRHEALDVGREATDRFRQLACTLPDAFNPNLAGALNSLSNRLSGVGRRDEALTAALEAVDIYRQLAQARPDTFNPDLAAALNNLSIRLSDLDRQEEAMITIEEAVALYQNLYNRHPMAFAVKITRTLSLASHVMRGQARTKDLIRLSLQALALAATHKVKQPDGLIASTLKAERRVHPDEFDAAWQEITGSAVPDGL